MVQSAHTDIVLQGHAKTVEGVLYVGWQVGGGALGLPHTCAV